MQSIDNLIERIKLSRDYESNITITFNESHIVLKALLDKKNNRYDKVYLLVSCKEDRVDLLDIEVYRTYESAYKEMEFQYNELMVNNSIISSYLGSWGASINFQGENDMVPYVWSISEREI